MTIETEEQYAAAVAETDTLLDEVLVPGSPEERRTLELLAALEDWELAHIEPMREPTEQEAREFFIDQGHTPERATALAAEILAD